MKKIYFKDIKSLSCDITDKLDAFANEFGDVSIITKYDEAKEIIKELICIGYDIASLAICKEEYWDEYIISISKEGNIPVIWCEKFKHDNRYLNDQSSITYVLDSCSSKCLATIKSLIQYEVSIGDDNESCSEESKQCSGKADDDENDYHITIKGNLDLDEAFAKLNEMVSRMERMSEIFDEKYNFRKLFNW